MNKIILLLIVLLCASLGFATNDTTCTDSDEGLEYYIKGYLNTSIVPDTQFEDYCLDSSNLIERHCLSNDSNNFTIQYECQNGCYEGACLPSCEDSDEGEYKFTFGEVNFSIDTFNSTNIDECAVALEYDEFGNPVSWTSDGYSFSCEGDDCYVQEAYCAVNEFGNFYDADATNMIKCNDGCANGACIVICEETDNGLNYYVKGFLNTSVVPDTQQEDYCLDEANLIEKHCVGENPYNYTVQYACPGGCLNGTCQPFCTDSDDGLNYDIKGYLNTSASQDTQFEDYCLDSSNLIERHCLSNDSNNFTVQHTCSYGCANDACVDSSYWLTTDIAVLNFSVNSFGGGEIIIRNNMAEEITINSINITNSINSSRTWQANNEVNLSTNDGNIHVISVPSLGSYSVGTNESFNLTIIYTNLTNDTRAFTGNIPLRTTIIEVPCTDSDEGLSYYLQGSGYGIYNGDYIENVDSCGISPDQPESFDPSGEGDYVGELSCVDNEINVNYYECQYGCENGACLPSCTDSDRGENEFTFGEVNFSMDSFNSTNPDQCAVALEYDEFDNPVSWMSDGQDFSCEGDDCYVQEAYCAVNEFGNFYDADATNMIKCNDGCSNGACILICEETDSGVDYFTKGYLETSVVPDTTLEEYCIGNQVIERHCLGEDPNNFTIAYTCPNGCYEGACIEEIYDLFRGEVTFNQTIESILDKDNMPIALADGEIDANLDTFSYSQRLNIEDNKIGYNSFDNNTVVSLEFLNSAWTYQLVFPNPVNISDLKNSQITMLGKTFTFSSDESNTNDNIMLSSEGIDDYLNLGQPKMFNINHHNYVVTIVGGNSDPKSMILDINGVRKSFVEGEISVVDGLTIQVADLFITNISTFAISANVIVGGQDEIIIDENGDVIIHDETMDSLANLITKDENGNVSSISITFYPTNLDDNVDYLENEQILLDPLFNLGMKFDMSEEIDAETKDYIELHSVGNEVRLSFVNRNNEEISNIPIWQNLEDSNLAFTAGYANNFDVIYTGEPIYEDIHFFLNNGTTTQIYEISNIYNIDDEVVLRNLYDGTHLTFNTDDEIFDGIYITSINEDSITLSADTAQTIYSLYGTLNFNESNFSINNVAEGTFTNGYFDLGIDVDNIGVKLNNPELMDNKNSYPDYFTPFGTYIQLEEEDLNVLIPENQTAYALEIFTKNSEYDNQVFIPEDDQGILPGSGNFTIGNNQSNIIIPGLYDSSEIEIPENNTNNVYFNMSYLLDLDNFSINIPQNLTISRTEDGTKYTVVIPANTTIEGGVNWDATISAPKVELITNYSVSSGTMEDVVSVGADVELNFSNPVKIVIAGMAGKKAAWSHGTGEMIKVTTTCNANLSVINQVSPRECSVDSGADLIIWTYHFTTFGAYTPDTNNGGGSSSSSAAPASTPKLNFKNNIENILSGNNAKYILNISDSNYNLTIKEVKANSVVYNFSNTIREVLINNTDKIAITENKTLSIRLNEIKLGKANMTLVLENKVIAPSQIIVKDNNLSNTNEGAIQNAVTSNNAPTYKDKETSTSSWTKNKIVWIAAIIFIIIAIIVTIFVIRKKDKYYIPEL